MLCAMTEPHPAVLVLVSADAEWAPVVEALRPERLERCPYGNFFVRPVGGTPILFLHGGWGKIAAAASTEYAISRWQPQVLMNLGTCGGIRGRAQRGEKLLVMRAIPYDIQESMGSAEAAILARTTEIDLTWLDDEFPIPVRRTHIVSGDRDLVPSEVTGLVRDFDAVAGDWESSAIAYVAARRGVPLLIIRAVSDLVDEVAGETIGALPVFKEAAAAAMRSLLADLESLVPYVLNRSRYLFGASA